MIAVFSAVGKAIRGKQLRPEHVAEMVLDSQSIVPDHEVFIRHVPKAETGQKRGSYLITITGPRIKGQWNLRPGEMDALCREAAAS